MDATHRDICTYYAPSDPLYLPVLAQIVRCSSIQSAKLDEPLAVPGSCSLGISLNFCVRYFGLCVRQRVRDPRPMHRLADSLFPYRRILILPGESKNWQ